MSLAERHATNKSQPNVLLVLPPVTTNLDALLKKFIDESLAKQNLSFSVCHSFKEAARRVMQGGIDAIIIDQHDGTERSAGWVTTKDAATDFLNKGYHKDIPTVAIGIKEDEFKKNHNPTIGRNAVFVESPSTTDLLDWQNERLTDRRFDKLQSLSNQLAEAVEKVLDSPQLPSR